MIPLPPPTTHQLLATLRATLATATLQLADLTEALLQPRQPPPETSPPGTLLIPGGSLTSIIDTNHNTWSLIPYGPIAAPTLHLNGHPDPVASPVAQALWATGGDSAGGDPTKLQLYFQRTTGQWWRWSTNHWLPSIDPRQATSPDWGPVALRATTATGWDWLSTAKLSDIDWNLLTELFTDNSHRADTFIPSPIPLVLRPRTALRPPVFQRSDNTFLLPVFGHPSPVTFQFPGLRPTFIRLWSALVEPETPMAPEPRVLTGTDTVAVAASPGSLHIIELVLDGSPT